MLARLVVAGSLIAIATSLAPATPALAGSSRSETTNRTWSTGNEGDHFAYVLVKKSQSKHDGRTRTDNSSSGSGETEDFRAARNARDRLGVDLLWARVDDRTYVIRDKATMDDVEEILLPQELLGHQQGLLGKSQSRLGREQSKLGRDQAELGVRQARLSARQSQLSSEIARRAAQGRDTGDLDREMRALASAQDEIGRRQSELGEEQSKLGEQQAELGNRQSELGTQQGELAKEAERKIESVVRRATKSGLAQPID